MSLQLSGNFPQHHKGVIAVVNDIDLDYLELMKPNGSYIKFKQSEIVWYSVEPEEK